jgi:uncharacterized coiled-coil protein SlyX
MEGQQQQCDLCDRYKLEQTIHNQAEQIEQLKACIAQQAEQIELLQSLAKNKISQ